MGLINQLASYNALKVSSPTDFLQDRIPVMSGTLRSSCEEKVKVGIVILDDDDITHF